MMRRLRTIVDMQPGEVYRSFAMFTYFFLIMAAYYVIKPATRSLFIEQLGAVSLPFAYISTALVIGFALGVWERLIDRFPRHHLVLISSLFFAGSLLMLRVLLSSGSSVSSIAFYIWADVFSVTSVSMFWSFTNDVFDPGEGKRLFGFIGAGGTLGGWAGCQIAARLAPVVGTDNLLLIAATLMLLPIAVAFAVNRRVETAEAAACSTAPASSGPAQPDPASGWSLVASSRYLTLLTAMTGLMLTTSLFIEQQFCRVLEAQHMGRDSMTAFVATRDSWTAILCFLFQLFLTGRILKGMGILPALLLLPVVDMISSGLFMGAPCLAVVGWAKILDGCLKYGVSQAAKEVLFLPTSREVKYKAKAFIDMFFYRLAKGLAGVLMLVVTFVVPLTLVQFSAVAMCFALAWIAVVVLLSQEYRAALGSRVGELFSELNLSGSMVAPAGTQAAAPVQANPARRELSLRSLTGRHRLGPNVAAVFADLAERAGAPEIYQAYLLLRHGPDHARPIALECLDCALSRERERWALSLLIPEPPRSLRMAASAG